MNKKNINPTANSDEVKITEVEIGESEYLRMLKWRGISSIELACKKCQGSGVYTYANTTTWRGGIGGQALTIDVCDECWSTGTTEKTGVDLRKL